MSDLNHKTVSKSKRLTNVIIMLICGTGSIVFGKLQFQTQAVGRDGKKHYFNKPLWQNATMFLGMLLCFTFPFFLKTQEKKKDETKKPSSMKRLAKLTTAPATCDFLATYFMNIGLIFLPASMWQLLRGSIVIFSAILTVIYRKRKVPFFQWVGVSIVTIGLTLVGFAAIVGTHDTNGQQFSSIEKGVGIILVILAQFIQALQTIIEETLLHDYEDTNPAHIVGFEGLWGLLLCVVISAPIAYYVPKKSGFKEDSIDTFVMLGNSGFLIGICCVYIVVILLYNYTGMVITDFSSALLRNILDGLRTLFIWVTLIIIYYASPTSGFGEEWTNWSYLQLGGFIALVVGTFMYNKILKFPCFNYKEEYEQIKSVNVLESSDLDDDLSSLLTSDSEEK
ncbi:hypothetical protein M0813_08031 [Anaeramoeba flamelloides]|uniref:EamA domain-containing protein n=1 Tax=Anaeramoeba flamelloides TaxID=1746091 RepID=A0AAV7ZYX6_9EUKA|nr:hypothetical protein M0812_08869 [Anaeramoeba flamelloides]KAJ6229114.1 hypothetical protein M0813_08031 [Anaeramoeba flamelloides]